MAGMLSRQGRLGGAFHFRRGIEKGFYTVASNDDSRKHSKHDKKDKHVTPAKKEADTPSRKDGHTKHDAVGREDSANKPTVRKPASRKATPDKVGAEEAERREAEPSVREKSDSGKATPVRSDTLKVERGSGSARSASSHNSRVHSHVKADDLASPEKKRERAWGRIVAIVVAVVVGVAIGSFAFIGLHGMNGEGNESSPIVPLTVTDIQYNEDGELINPVDWNEWIGRNPDVYGWLTIPGTEVDYPLVQHPIDDNYYLTHNIDGEKFIDGVPYTQKTYNSKDLTSDKVTVVYGHTFQEEDTMFSTLHNFEDQAFFDEHPTFVVYTPTQRLEYEVVSAFEYDNRHILQTQDMSDPAVAEEFFAMVQDPDSQNEKVRQLDAPLDPNSDHLLVLSTCTKPSDSSKRYLVCSVLRDVQGTEEKEIDMSGSIIESEVIFDPNAETGAPESSE